MKCYYYQCENNDMSAAYRSQKSFFRFPVKNPELLEKWIENAGNDELKDMTLEQLANRRLCSDHFDKQRIHKINFRNKLVGPAVPFPAKKPGSNSSNLTEDVKNKQPKVLNFNLKALLSSKSFRIKSTEDELNLIRPLPSAKRTSVLISEKCEFNPKKVLNTYSRKKRKVEFQVTPLYNVKVEPFNENESNKTAEPNSSKTDVLCNVEETNISDKYSKKINTTYENVAYVKHEPMESSIDEPQAYVKTEPIEPISEDEKQCPKNLEGITVNGTLSYLKMEQNSEGENYNESLESKGPVETVGNVKMEANDEILSHIKVEPETDHVYNLFC